MKLSTEYDQDHGWVLRCHCETFSYTDLEPLLKLCSAAVAIFPPRLQIVLPSRALEPIDPRKFFELAEAG